VPERREGLASAVNNTARQAAGAIGIAVAGAIAGQSGNAGFTDGFHAVALLAACLYLLTAAAALFLIPAKPAREG
jgi:DHA2 family methylenomycin A resistance protein-like MFS transporter